MVFVRVVGFQTRKIPMPRVGISRILPVGRARMTVCDTKCNDESRYFCNEDPGRAERSGPLCHLLGEGDVG